MRLWHSHWHVPFYSITTGSDFILKAWLVPMLLVGQPIHLLVELPEHIGCAAASTDPLRNTRSIGGSWFSRWFTNGNNFHVEHHILPALSMDQLRKERLPPTPRAALPL